MAGEEVVAVAGDVVAAVGVEDALGDQVARAPMVARNEIRGPQRRANPDGDGFLPFTKAFVPVVEIAEKRIVAALPDDFFAPARARPDDGDEA